MKKIKNIFYRRLTGRSHLVKLFDQGKQIAIHQRLLGRGFFSTNENHYPHYKLPFSSCSKQRLSDRMQGIGDYACQLFAVLLRRHSIINFDRTRNKFGKEAMLISCLWQGIYFSGFCHSLR